MEFTLGMMLKVHNLLISSILLFCFSGALLAQTKFSDGYEAARSGNYKKAVQIWQSLATQGDPAAQYTIGWMYESGQGVTKDFKKAIYWYQKAAMQGNPAAQYVAATMYAKGAGIEQDDSQALHYFLLAAKQGDAISQYQAGNYYLKAIGTKQDIKQSIYWYQQSAEQGHVNAQISLGKLYQDPPDNNLGVKQDYKKSIYWYQQAANQKNVTAQYELAMIYEKGLGEKQNYSKAIQLYTKSANSGYSPSAYQLGRLLELGQGSPSNFSQALIWFRQAALQGNTDAQYRLGYLSQMGKGTTKNIQVAIEWYTQASRRDHAQAYYQLAQIYEYGTSGYPHDINRNLQKAFKNYQYASALGFKLAHAKLAYFYEYGIFTKVNKAEAIALYKKASQTWAKTKLEKLINHEQCLNTATTLLFSELISCADRALLRDKIKQQSIKVLSEDNSQWSDRYFTGAMIKGSSELTIDYTRENQFVKATYTFVGRNNPALIGKIKQQLTERYGQPHLSIGEVLKGEATFQWTLKDSIILNVYRFWPDTTTFVEYIQPHNQQLQKAQQQQSMDHAFRPESEKQQPESSASATMALF